MVSSGSSDISSRQFHKTSSAYVLPNDATEQDRLDVQAATIVNLIGGYPFLGVAHVNQQVSKAVDIGCGTGVATLQLARAFPSAAQVWGIDISPIPEATKQIAPPNVSWAVGNILEVDSTNSNDILSHKIFAQDSLDYAFGRMLFLGINNWPRYYTTIRTALKPGAIVEQQEIDWGWFQGAEGNQLSDTWPWYQKVKIALQKCGLTEKTGSTTASMMTDAGLEVVTAQQFNFGWTGAMPSEGDADDQGEQQVNYIKEKFLTMWPVLLTKLLGAIGIGGDELQGLIAQSARDIGLTEGLYMRYTVAVARKPL